MLTRKFLITSLIEFGPITAFFIGTEVSSFFLGAALLVVGTALSLIASLTIDGRVPLFSLVSSFFVLVFGTLTLYLHDARWLVLEYTLYNGIFGISLLIGHFYKKCLLKRLFQHMFHITDAGWLILSFRWSFVFIITAILNQVIWQYLGEMPWIYFRVVAGVVLALFGFSQIFLARKHREPGASAWGLRQ